MAGTSSSLTFMSQHPWGWTPGTGHVRQMWARGKQCRWSHAGAKRRCTQGAVSGRGSERSDPVFVPLQTVEAGCVLVASPDEIDHFMRHAVCLVLSHDARGSRGVLLEMATAFTVGEMATPLADTPFSELPLFRGGGGGKDQILMVHDVSGLARANPVGAQGIHVGGLQAARDAVAQGLLRSDRFKFFFNQCEWLPGALEREVEQGIWTGVGLIPAEMVLRQVSSQSERPLGVERKLGNANSMDAGKPLWDILQEYLAQLAQPPESGDALPQEPEPIVSEASQDSESGGGAGAGCDGARTYLAALPRRQLQSLAKDHGIKANIKSTDIIQHLLQLGFSAPIQPSSPQPADAPRRDRQEHSRAQEVRDSSPAVGQRAYFLQMMTERIWKFRQQADVGGLLPLLDVGAEVYGEKRAGSIEDLLKARWRAGEDARMLPETLRLLDSGCGMCTPLCLCPRAAKSAGAHQPLRSSHCKVHGQTQNDYRDGRPCAALCCLCRASPRTLTTQPTARPHSNLQARAYSGKQGACHPRGGDVLLQEWASPATAACG